MNEQQLERFHEFIAGWLRDHFDKYSWMPNSSEVVKVINVKEFTKYGGYCSTCYYEDTNVMITYVNSAGVEHEYEYSGSMSELIGFEN